MRRITIAVMGTLSGLVLLFSYHTSLGGGGGGGGITTALAPPAPLPSAGASVAGQSGPTASPTGSSSAGPQQSAGSTVNGTFTGGTADTRWGPVQVQIVVQNSKIVNATALQYPNGNGHDAEINSWAVPQLQQATVSTNGNNFDALSGATVTSDGYKSSLQSALDQAHL
jgi:uncharacterized protein with FMN-binding domain